MHKSEATVTGSLAKLQTNPHEQAVTALLKPPALSYVREIQQAIDKDPNFLAFHDQSVGLKILKLLSEQGIYWDEEAFESDFLRIVKEAVIRVRGLAE